MKVSTQPKIICLCGSTKFAEVFNEETIRLTKEGYIVLRPEVVEYNESEDPQIHDVELKERLDDLHLWKIMMADEVRIINCNRYVGESTLREIAFASGLGRPISWYEEQ